MRRQWQRETFNFSFHSSNVFAELLQFKEPWFADGWFLFAICGIPWGLVFGCWLVLVGALVLLAVSFGRISKLENVPANSCAVLLLVHFSDRSFDLNATGKKTPIRRV